MTRAVRLPTPGLIQLGELHDAYRISHRNNLSPEYFCYEVGTRLCALPEDGLGFANHMPVCRLNTFDSAGFGWSLTDVMLLLPAVSEEDVIFQRCLTGRIGEFLVEQLKETGYEIDSLHATHALRFAKPEVKAYGSRHKADNAVFARADCYACDPKLIITFGADALKSLFGKDAKVDNYRGAVYDWEGIKVVPTVSPYVFSKSTGGLDVFQTELFRGLQCLLNHSVPSGDNNGKLPPGDWRVLETVEAVEAFEAFLQLENHNDLAIDCEFGNVTAREEDHFILSWQVSWGAEQAAIIEFFDDQDRPLYTAEDLIRVKAAITRICNRAGVQLSGHALSVDVDMPYREGMDYREKLATGFDTMLAYHLLHGGSGDEGQGLDHLVRKYVPHYGAYWKPLEDWLTATGERSSILRFGYRPIPRSIRTPYALKDASATWIAKQAIQRDLAQQPRLQALFTDVIMPTSLALMDVQSHGIKQDRERIKYLASVYRPEYDSMLAEFRDMVNWPDFNPGSADQKLYFLHHTTAYRDRDVFIRKHGERLKDVKLLGLPPQLTTGKYPKEWAQIAAAAEEHLYRPSTKGSTIDLLVNAHPAVPELKLLKNLSILGKFLSTYLVEPELNEFGLIEAGKNISNCLWKDGRVRGHLLQTSETGRYRMYGANLQCNPKKQEDSALGIFTSRRFDGMELSEYKRRCDDSPTSKTPEDERIPKNMRITVPTVKSAFIAEEGNVLIEADFMTAEIAVWAYCSGDPLLIEIIESNRDIHAETAIDAYGLPGREAMEAAIIHLKATGDMRPYKRWNAEFKVLFSDKRDSIKAVVFGCAYGKSAFSLARDISKTGYIIDTETAEGLIGSFAVRFPMAWAWLMGNQESAIRNGYVETAFGRKRYFPGIQQMPEQQQKAAKREASNSPIQGTTADLLSVAGINLYRTRYHTELGCKVGFKTLLPIHDAFLFELPKIYVSEMKLIIKHCMSTMNTIPGTAGKRLGVKVEVFEGTPGRPARWGEEQPHT